MKFTETGLPGAFIVELEERADSRGFFARAYCEAEFEKVGIKTSVVQCNLSFNHKRGTMRGMHMQVAPALEAKLVRCIRGAVYDAIVDMRPESPTYLQSFGLELTAENRKALFIPESFAHGYLTLADNTEMLYQVSEFYTPGTERGFRYNDPSLTIEWPIPVEVISDKDATWALLGEAVTN